ncbi:MAG: hypothetical protein ACD_19C00219G0004 [uncultured bacterium]|nr:MAG: hypothetical protein ACD_19C00219G0004 [uncultured bacterium]
MSQEENRDHKKNFIQKILFIEPEKKWWKEAFEWLITYAFSFFIATADSLRDWNNFATHWSSFWESYGVLLIILPLILKLLYNYLRDFRKSFDDKLDNDIISINKKTDDISSIVDKYLNKAKIVFESGINEFDDNHLLALQRILCELNVKESNLIAKDNQATLNIYAIDNSDPRTWWSDTMTGYLALLANWKSLDNKENRRAVHRIFVCQKNELLSPVFVKTISLHSLMGFKTYIITHQMYKRLFDEICSNNPRMAFKEKEVLIWTQSVKNGGKIIETPLEVSFKLDKLGHSKVWDYVKCYQSFWEIGSDYNERSNFINKTASKVIYNFYGHEICSSNIDIWFEFIAKEKADDKRIPDKKLLWEELPISYIILIQELIKKMECCKDANEVKHINAELPFGIEIKTLSCSVCSKSKKNNCDHSINNGTNFDFTSATDVREILKEYYNKLN